MGREAQTALQVRRVILDLLGRKASVVMTVQLALPDQEAQTALPVREALMVQ